MAIGEDAIKVSVFCMTYNHALYIESALKGFVSQKTSFRFEVFVHDDASTDGTKEIIQKYADKYPEIIKPIFETQNQYSRINSVINEEILPQTNGDYVAICEGDDYWSDENKLQVEYDFLESHPDYVACTHNTLVHECATGEEYLMFGTKDKDISFEEVAKGGLSCYHVSSLMFRKEYTVRPACFYEKGVGDFPQSLYLTLSGKVRYLGRVMSVYRHGLAGSWTDRMGSSPELYEQQMKREANMLNNIDTYLNYSKHEVLSQAVLSCYFRVDFACGRYKDIVKKAEYKVLINEMSLKRRMVLYLHAYCPKVMDYYKSLKRRY